MRLVLFSSKPYDRDFFRQIAGPDDPELVFLEPRLDVDTANLVQADDLVCAFVNDDLSRPVLEVLAARGVRHIVLRCAGYNNLDLTAARELGFAAARVPAYSPHAVAEHTLGLMLTLNRKIHRAHYRAKELNFSLNGLLGFDMYGKTVGVIGTGKIGQVVVRILAGFGCRILAHDPNPHPDCLAAGAVYVPLDQLFAEADIISLHCPLIPATHHLIDGRALAAMKRGVTLINTSRGGLLDTGAAIAALKTGQLGYLGLDVYEEEAGLFFEDLSNTTLSDDVFARLLTFPNVIITAHQGFFTREALENIVHTTLANVRGLLTGHLPEAHRVV